MKNVSWAILFVLSTGTCLAQGVFNNQTNYVLEKVVQDYPSRFKNIRGEQISSKAGVSDYKSVIVIPGSVSTVITQAAEAQKQTVCWQSVVYSGKQFNAAKTRFEELFNQIKNTVVKPEGEKAAIVNGLYMDPSEEKTFTTIQFDLLPMNATLQKVNIDLMLRNTGKEWKIILSVYDKDMKEMDALTAR